MKKWLLILVIGYVYFDSYLSCDYIVYPVLDDAQSRAGVYLSYPLELEDSLITPFLENETFMAGIGEPIQINYILGVKIDMGNIEVKLYHECQHPIQKDLPSNDRNSLGIKYSF